MNGANLSTAAAGRSSKSLSTTPATFAQAPFPFSDRPFKGESKKQLPRELPGSSWAPFGWQHRPGPGPSPRAADLRGSAERAAGDGPRAGRREGRRAPAGLRDAEESAGRGGNVPATVRPACGLSGRARVGQGWATANTPPQDLAPLPKRLEQRGPQIST